MIIYDQYETEPISTYSGSYLSVVTYGSFFKEKSNFNKPVIADKVGGIISSSFFNNNYTYLMSNYSSIVFGSALGRAEKFTKLQSEGEYIFDSIMSHPLNYSNINGANPIIYNPSVSGSAMFNITPTTMSASAFLVIGTTRSVVSSSSGVRASDNSWIYSYPFQSKYKNIKRYFSTGPITPEPIITSLSWSSNFVVKDLISPISVNRIASIDFVTRSFSNAGNPNAQGWTTDYLVNSGTIMPNGIINDISTINNFYFGVGTGENGMTNNSLYKTLFPSAFSISLWVFVSPILRGYKYGIYNANKVTTSAIYRQNSFGNFRDMLEQRQYTKIFDKFSNRTTGGPINITFVSGSLPFKYAKDYMTASAPSYNPNDSGIYDFEYKSGKPFSD